MRACGMCLSVALLLTLATSVARCQDPIEIGSRRELMVDRHLIATLTGGAELHLHKPSPQEIVIRHEEPWEGNTSAYHTIFKDGDRYRMYYRASHSGKPKHPPFTCYAESKDGIHWKKPNLGLYEFNGSKKNNIVWKGIGTHNFVPFKDPNPNCKPEARYKAIGRGEGGLYAFQSSDGLHWSLMSEEPIITKGAFDSQNLAFWDPVRKEYRDYHRDFRHGHRDIRTCTSQDFLNWSEPVFLKYPEAPHEHLYTNQIRPYYRAPHIFIGFPTRYIPGRGSLTEGLFMTSRDGRTFHRWQEAVIRPGLNPEKWQNRSNYIWWGLVETESAIPGAPKELSLYSNESYYDGPGVNVRRYTYRIDGFVSLQAPYAGGEMVTKPLIFEGEQLEINFSTSAAGRIQIELQNADGQPIEGFALSDCPAIYGDAIKRIVNWKSDKDLAALAGKPVRLRFVLQDADLYSFRFQ